MAQGSDKWLILWVILAKLVSLAAVILIAVFIAQFLPGGFNWSQSTFNFHPLFMTIGVIYVLGDAVLVYRVLPNTSKIAVKLVHALLQFVALVFMILGLYAVFSVKGPFGNNVRSLHSWVGIVTFTLYCFQLLGGLITFLVPGLSLERRNNYKPNHAYWGVALLALAGLACVLGAYGIAKGNPTYTDLDEFGLLLNFYGVSVIVTVLITAYILTKSGYRREDEEEIDGETIPLK